MPKAEDLYAALLDGDVQTTLGETAMLLGDGAFTLLEDTWIAAMGAIGERMPTGLWASVGEAMRDLLKADTESLAVRDAFRMSVSVALLFRRVAAAGKRRAVRGAISGLRANVTVHFPEGASLSAAGAQQFAKLFTGMTQTERAFAERIIAGLCRLWAEKRADDLREAMEYLTRRRNLVMPVVAEWAVSRDEGDRGEIIWLLWAIIRVYFGGRPEILAMWDLFVWTWRRGVKTDRLGLLWGAAVAGGTGAADWSWNAQEAEMLQKVTDKSAELWKALAPAPVADAASPKSGGSDDGGSGASRGGGGGGSRMDLWLGYIPRGTADEDGGGPSAAAAAAAASAFKSLKIKAECKGRRSANENGNGSTAVVKNGGNGVGSTASGSFNSGYRRLHSGEERPNSQAVFSEKAARQPMGQPHPFQQEKRAPMEGRYGLRAPTRPADKDYPWV